MRHVITCFESALNRLPGKGPVEPFPILATVEQRAKENGKRWSLALSWVEEGQKVDGFYLVDAAGNTTDYPVTISFPANDEAELANTAWRSFWVPAIASVSDKGWQGTKDKPPQTPLLLPIEACQAGQARLGLLHNKQRLPTTVIVGSLIEP